MATSGIVFWFTGLSGSGKTTIANALKERLTALGRSALILDGDAVRNSTHRHLGFSREDIRENNRLLAELAAKRANECDVVIVAIISPFRKDRKMARGIIGERFREVFVNRPLGLCIARDEKGLYKKALAGAIKNFIGIDPTTPYEPPEAPDVELETDTETKEENVQKLLTFLGK